MGYVNNASAIVYDFISEKIKTGEWREGDKIWTEARLCSHLGISRVAVRQAIDRLVALSVLYKKQGSGTFVLEKEKQQDMFAFEMNEDNPEELLDILEFRRYFEYGNVLMFIKNAGNSDIEALEAAYEEMKEAAVNDDMTRFYVADYRFHDIIARGTKKAFIYKISITLNNVLNQHQAKLNAAIGPEIGLEYHAYILDSIKRKDKQLAGLYMQRHIDVTIEAIKKISE